MKKTKEVSLTYFFNNVTIRFSMKNREGNVESLKILFNGLMNVLVKITKSTKEYEKN